MMADYREDRAQQAPEVVNQGFPEALPQNQYKPEHGGTGSYVSGTAPHSQVSPSPFLAGPVEGARGPEDRQGASKRRGTICGCTALVFVLSVVIALLSAAVIGLAAGTGVEAHMANTAQAEADQLRSSRPTATVTVTSSTSTSTSFAQLDDNCSSDPSAVTGTQYFAFSLISNASFTIQCNKDTDGNPLMSLFTSNLNGCMDACAAYSRYLHASFVNDTKNTTCGAVSFVPLWTNQTAALEGSAPGNCYLKPTQTAAPSTPDIGTEVHAGILNSD